MGNFIAFLPVGAAAAGSANCAGKPVSRPQAPSAADSIAGKDSICGLQETRFTDILQQAHSGSDGHRAGSSQGPFVQLLGRIGEAENLSTRHALLLALSLGNSQPGWGRAEQGSFEEGILMPGRGRAQNDPSGEENAVCWSGAWMGLQAFLQYPEHAEGIGGSARADRVQELIRQMESLLDRLQSSFGNEPLSNESGVVGPDRGVGGKPGHGVFPDFIYFSEAAGRNRAAETGHPKILLVSVPENVEDAPIRALQGILKNLQDGNAQTDRTAGTHLPFGIERFLASRLEHDAHPGFLSSAISENLLPDSVSAVRQAQAVIRDMLERMEGVVRFEEGARAVIHLEPPALGRVQVQLLVDDLRGGVEARVGAEHEATREFLKQNQSDLRQELARQGFEEAKIRICFLDEETPALEQEIYASRMKV